jgi:ketosteroid isomerase-like protein
MSAAENKQLVRKVFEELERGSGRRFVDLLAEDVRWTIIGDTAWSGTWEGRSSVRADLLDPLFAQFATTYRAEVVRLIAEGDWVVIEFRGDVTTQAGRPYRNVYCYVCRLEDGKVKEICEYCDTQLLTEALAPPEPRVVA